MSGSSKGCAIAACATNNDPTIVNLDAMAMEPPLDSTRRGAIGIWIRVALVAILPALAAPRRRVMRPVGSSQIEI
jgi:hypothetical protein